MKILLLLTLLFDLFLPGCKANPTGELSESRSLNSTVEYYSTLPLRESPYPDFAGVVRLTKAKAMKRNHYRFSYDKKGRLKEVSFRKGDKIIGTNHTANYFFQTPIQRFEYERNKEIRTFFDRHGNQTTVRKVYREIYIYDERGKKAELYFEDKAGDRVENSWNIARYTWDIQADGSVIENRYSLGGELQSLRPAFPFFTIRLFYEQNGLLALMQNVDGEGNPVENKTGAAQDKLEFDAEGRWYGWNVLDKDGNPENGNGPNVAKGINTPDKWGYETAIRYEDESGKPIINSHGFWGSRRFYDEFGNYAYTHFVDAAGKPAPNIESGYTFAEYTYADNGIDRMLIEFFDEYRQAIAHKTRGYSKIKEEYDDNHNVTKISFLDTAGNLVNRTDNGIAFIVPVYDDNMARTGSELFDKDGKKLN